MSKCSGPLSSTAQAAQAAQASLAPVFARSWGGAARAPESYFKKIENLEYYCAHIVAPDPAIPLHSTEAGQGEN